MAASETEEETEVGRGMEKSLSCVVESRTVTEEGPSFFSVDPSDVTIPPGESISVVIAVKERESYQELQAAINDLFFIVRDDRLARVPGKKVAVSLLTQSRPIVSTRSGLEIDTSSIANNNIVSHSRLQDDLPVLILRVTNFSLQCDALLLVSYPISLLQGCTPIALRDEDQPTGGGQRYEIIVGQKHVGSGDVTWELTLENSSANAPRNQQTPIVEYKIYAVTGNEAWLVIGFYLP